MAKVTLQLPASIDDAGATFKLGGPSFDGIVRARPQVSYRVDQKRSAAKASVLKTQSDAIVELELEGGVRLWTTPAQLKKDFPAAKLRSSARGSYTVPLTLPFAQPGTVHEAVRGARGAGEWVLKALRLIDVDVAATSAAAIARKLEAKLEPGPGLYRIEASEQLTLTPAAKLNAQQPLLIFLHGTASNTRAGFGDLWATPDGERAEGDLAEAEKRTLREQLRARYGAAMYAFEHRTLTESPIENALALAQALPKGARLHLVSHSRGGLVGELLCRGGFSQRAAFSAADIALFSGNERAKDRAALQELNRVLKEKQLRVERFVRVACPARGTTLASGRLDRWLSVIVNVLGTIPGFSANPVYEFVTALMLAVIKQRTQPSELPGIEAMMPQAPLIRMLNLVDARSASDLSVIAGDVEGDGLYERLKFLLTDWFYRSDHDLVVDTPSMSGGAPRASGARKFFERGSRVNHFRYFRNPESVRKLYAGLLRSDHDDAGYEPLVVTYQQLAARSSKHSARQAGAARPSVFVLPGIMGTHLSVRGNRIWLDPFDLAAGGMASLRIDAKGVEPEALMGVSYGKLVAFLSATHDVVPFAYDWRLPLADSAQRLALALSAKLDEAERNRQPVRILAHSMGGLVTRMMIAEHGEQWQRMCKHPDARFIMLGTPNGGSYSIPVMLTARDALVGKLAFLDLGHSEAELLAVVARFPGVLQMLPVQTGWDFFDPKLWAQLAQNDFNARTQRWALPAPADLAAARAARAKLDALTPDPQRMLYVAGCAEATPHDLQLETGAAVGERLQFQATAQGDGRVPWANGILAGIRTWYMPATHGDLANQTEHFPALLELLTQGTTTRLSSTPPPLSRAARATFPLPRAAAPVALPDEEELVAAALGGSTRGRAAAATRPRERIGVAVLHGNLAFTSHVVAVGHYQGDSIVSAEAYLNRRLDGRLSAQHQLGLYPGAPDTAEVFLNAGDNKPAGAIVVGLGQVGELKPVELTKSFKRGVLRYAALMAERYTGGQALSLTLGSLLIGTRAGGIGVDDALFAMLRGLAQAVDALAETPYRDRVRIDGIEFIELYEDRAIQATHALLKAARDTQFATQFGIEPEVRRLPGGHQRLVLDDERDWWRRLQILALAQDDTLQFNTLTDRARVEVRLQATQRTLVDKFIEQAAGQTETDIAVGATLFELLLPNELKDQAPNQENLILVLNDGAARYPWELLCDGRLSHATAPVTASAAWQNGGTLPLAVQSGMIRQLQTSEFRAQVHGSTRDNVLVIGDPDLGAAHRLFPRLEGAQREAQQVAKQVQGRAKQVELLVREDATRIVQALFADEYKVLHLAGHGVFDFTPADTADEPVSGMVIGDGVYLTPHEVEQMRSVPELVFINCCHLGRVEEMPPHAMRDRHKLAANLAAQFIRMGVKAVVAAGWEVDDAAAARFACEFYRRMYDGMPFGDAVRESRKVIYDEYLAVNTWGAYQCYGDHAYCLRMGAPAQAWPDPVYVSPSEVVQELQNLLANVPSATPAQLRNLLAQAQRIQQHLTREHSAWLQEPRVAAALGAAYGELDEFETAIACYARALQAPSADYPMRTIEQLANLRARHAAQLADAPKLVPAERKRIQELLTQALNAIEQLLALGTSVERLSIAAGIYKRIALLDSKQRKPALEHMVQRYQQASALAQQNAAPDPYPQLNALAGQAALELLAGKSPAGLAKSLAAMQVPAKAAENYWSWVQEANLLLVKALIEGDIGSAEESIVDGYRNAAARASTPREDRSARENLRFLIALLNVAPRNAHNRRLLTQLNKLAAAVQKALKDI